MTCFPDFAFLHQLADRADAVTLPLYRTALTSDDKGGREGRFDPVTRVDREAERAIREAIAQRFPAHGILGEEGGQSGKGPDRWVIDPVDGTRPFLCGLPLWATLIGFERKGRARLGMMSQPYVRERFWADGKEAWTSRDGAIRALRTRQGTELAGAVLHTTSPDGFGGLTDAFLRLRSAVRMTRFGGEGYATAMLAAGHIDLCLEPSLQSYDICALIPIVEGAGGVVTQLDGSRAERGGAVLASANAALHEAALSFLSP